MVNSTDRGSGNRFSLDVHLNGEGVLDSLADDVRAGLTASPKRLSPKYFYDDAGSGLFEQITHLPEYYPTRAERGLLEDVTDDLMAELRPFEILELGSGSSTKTRVLLSARTAPEHLRRYVPFDVSEGIVRSTAADLLNEYDYLTVHGVIGDFEHHLGLIPQSEGPRLVLFLGGTIGNLDPDDQTEFLCHVRALLAPADHLLIGLDLVKDVDAIEAAYNDSAGVTAEFNRNMLRVINRELVADFQPDAFTHQAFFNASESRIEMHLAPTAVQHVRIDQLGITITVQPDETIWTENSYKFTEDSVKTMLASAGLKLQQFYTNDDPQQLFGLVLAAPE
jgi:L-histidine N-alpha-methyltransferase